MCVGRTARGEDGYTFPDPGPQVGASCHYDALVNDPFKVDRGVASFWRICHHMVASGSTRRCASPFLILLYTSIDVFPITCVAPPLSASKPLSELPVWHPRIRHERVPELCMPWSPMLASLSDSDRSWAALLFQHVLSLYAYATVGFLRLSGALYISTFLCLSMFWIYLRGFDPCRWKGG